MKSSYRGGLDPNDLAHMPVSDPSQTSAPFTIKVADDLFAPQFAPAVSGPNNGYDPAGDCNGLFMPYKMQPHNNCYNYACDNATSSFAWPGKNNNYKYQTVPGTPPPGTSASIMWLGSDLVQAAQQDGLLRIADPGPNISDLQVPTGRTGWFVALLVAPPDANFVGGDFHWVRCDNKASFDSWSQKDGGYGVTNFDFAGNPITDPRNAIWTTNDGPWKPLAGADVMTTYTFYAFMFVPYPGVTIV